MIDVTQHGILPSNDGLTNRAVLFALYNAGQSSPEKRKLYWPGGSNQLAPVNSTTAAGVYMRYHDWSGDGIKNTELTMIDEETEGLFDFQGLDCFDVKMEGMSLYGNVHAPFIMRLGAGGNNYRIQLSNMQFRGNAADGLIIGTAQFVDLDFVTTQGCGGTGLHMKGTLGVKGHVNTEGNGIGLLIEGEPPNRTGDLQIDLDLYTERNAEGIIIRNCQGVRVSPTGAMTTFDGATNCQTTGRGYFTGGATRCSAAEGPKDDYDSGPDRWQNAVGDGLPMEVALGQFDPLYSTWKADESPPLEPFTIAREEGPTDVDISQNLTLGPKVLTFVSEAIRPGNGLIQVVAQRNHNNEWKWYNWRTREVTTAAASLWVPVSPSRKRFAIPFEPDVETSWRIRFTAPHWSSQKVIISEAQVVDA